jgi:hypothetical protein
LIILQILLRPRPVAEASVGGEDARAAAARRRAHHTHVPGNHRSGLT